MNRSIVVLCVIYLSLATLMLLLSLNAQAAVSLSGTRLIFDGHFTEARLDVINRNAYPVLIQAWVSDPANLDGRPETASLALPFALTPHLVRLEAFGRQTLRVLYQGRGMSSTQESLLHLYVLEIPRRVERSRQLSIAVRQRINLFYRPSGLTGDPADAALGLRWTLAGAEHAMLRVSNPTSFHVALQDVRLADARLSESLLLAPGAVHELPVPLALRSAPLAFRALNDYGGLRSYCAQPANDSEYRPKDC